MALAPQPLNVYAGDTDEEVTAKVGKEGARTIPVCSHKDGCLWLHISSFLLKRYVADRRILPILGSPRERW